MKTGNIFSELPQDLSEEVFDRLAERGQVRIERIVSQGHHSPENGWYDQNAPEWVIVLKGEAKVGFDDGNTLVLHAGDYLDIPAHKKHRVEWTTPATETIWLAVHY